MKARKFVMLLTVVFAAVVSVSPAPAQVNSASTNLHCVWKITGAHNTVYLVGSVHLLKPSDYPLAAPIETAFTNSQIVAFETDIEKMEDPAMQLSIMSKLILPEGRTLENELSSNTWQEFTNQVAQADMPLFVFTRFKPVAAAMSFSLLEIQKFGFDETHGLDQHYFQIAKKEGKQIIPLETLDFQLSLITDYTKEEGELLMQAELKEDLDTGMEKFNKVIQCWKTGDSKNLSVLLNESMEKSPFLFKRLVTDRNQRWVPKIQAFLSGNTNTVVIVGAGHLVGDEGVVELLKKKGLKVTQL